MSELLEFPDLRVCAVCGTSARRIARTPLPGEPRILSISGTIYRKGDGKSSQASYPAVRVCESCLYAVLGGNWWARWFHGLRLWLVLRLSLASALQTLFDFDNGGAN